PLWRAPLYGGALLVDQIVDGKLINLGLNLFFVAIAPLSVVRMDLTPLRKLFQVAVQLLADILHVLSLLLLVQRPITKISHRARPVHAVCKYWPVTLADLGL